MTIPVWVLLLFAPGRSCSYSERWSFSGGAAYSRVGRGSRNGERMKTKEPIGTSGSCGARPPNVRYRG